ncbi:MAG: YdcF family protein [Fusicatenibacter sp.]|nr:YdcF family protein [Fusicatenibacter sp.]
MYDRFLNNFTDFIFVEHEPKEADIIFIPGNGFPQMALEAAKLWKEGYAKWILPSGRYSTLVGHFSGVMAMQERFSNNYRTEWEFLHEVLRSEGVPDEVILREEQATYTYENALMSKKVTDEKGLEIHQAIICCKSHHARRCQMYYQLVYPDAELLICPSDAEVSRENWHTTAEGIDLVLGEIERCGGQFHKILRDLK